MPKPKEVIVSEISGYIDKRGGKYSDWYVGIASDPKARLFNDHNVDQKNGAWIYRECESADVAREVEDYFINTLRTKGGPGGGDDSTKSIYAYRTTSDTTEEA